MKSNLVDLQDFLSHKQKNVLSPSHFVVTIEHVWERVQKPFPAEIRHFEAPRKQQAAKLALHPAAQTTAAATREHAL